MTELMGLTIYKINATNVYKLNHNHIKINVGQYAYTHHNDDHSKYDVFYI